MTVESTTARMVRLLSSFDWEPSLNILMVLDHNLPDYVDGNE
jgi:hypothetical protein